MEITLGFEDYDERNDEEIAQIDKIRRFLFQKFPQGTWKRNGNECHKIAL